MKSRIHQRTGEERAVPGGRSIELAFYLPETPEVPATLLLPDAAARVAGVVLVHGYSSRKEQMSGSIGRALLSRGVASLAVDLPLHGTRRETGRVPEGPLALVKQWKGALAEVGLAVQYLRARPEVDPGRVALVGYSLGSFLATLAAAGEPSVRAVVVAAGGDLPEGLPFAPLLRTVVDPLRAVRRLGGRPLLVVHGRHDRTMRPEQARRLFEAAAEPKEMRWYDAGHYLPDAAVRETAGWLAERLAAPGEPVSPPGSPPGSGDRGRPPPG
jgi:dienelactone hydrolase